VVVSQSATRQGEAVEKMWKSLGSQSTWRRTETKQGKIWQSLGSQSKSRGKKKNSGRRCKEESTNHHDGRGARTGGGKGHPLFSEEVEEEDWGENEGYDVG
jgi:hypothetical protein